MNTTTIADFTVSEESDVNSFNSYKPSLITGNWATLSQDAEDKPIQEIVPLEIETFPHYDRMRNNSRLTENTVIAILLNNLGYVDFLGEQLFTDSMVFIAYENKSSLEEPLPSSTIVRGWGYYPSVVTRMFENEDSSYVFGKYTCNYLTGCSPEVLYENIDNGIPVMVYSTTLLRGTVYS